MHLNIEYSIFNMRLIAETPYVICYEKQHLGIYGYDEFCGLEKRMNATYCGFFLSFFLSFLLR